MRTIKANLTCNRQKENLKQESKWKISEHFSRNSNKTFRGKLARRRAALKMTAGAFFIIFQSTSSWTNANSDNTVRYKGIDDICENHACASLQINTQNKSLIVEQPASLTRIPITPDNTVMIDGALPPAIQLDLSYSKFNEPHGNGKRYVLDNHSRLQTGDQFTITIHSATDGWLYLYHIDPLGEQTELLSSYGHENKVTTTSTIQLPQADEHFQLDLCPGKERLYAVFSQKPIDHSQQLVNYASNPQASRYKGIVAQKDTHADTRVEYGERLVICPSAETLCIEPFIIDHLPGLQPSRCGA